MFYTILDCKALSSSRNHGFHFIDIIKIGDTTRTRVGTERVWVHFMVVQMFYVLNLETPLLLVPIHELDHETKWSLSMTDLASRSLVLAALSLCSAMSANHHAFMSAHSSGTSSTGSPLCAAFVFILRPFCSCQLIISMVRITWCVRSEYSSMYFAHAFQSS